MYVMDYVKGGVSGLECCSNDTNFFYKKPVDKKPGHGGQKC